MSFLSTAGGALAHAIDKNSDKWLDQGVSKLRSVGASMPGPGATVMTGVADKIASPEGRAALAGLTHAGTVEIASYLACGVESEARFIFLRDQASFAEAQDALKAAILGAAVKNRQNAEEWTKTKAFLLDLLLTAGKMAIPVLMAMI